MNPTAKHREDALGPEPEPEGEGWVQKQLDALQSGGDADGAIEEGADELDAPVAECEWRVETETTPALRAREDVTAEDPLTRLKITSKLTYRACRYLEALKSCPSERMVCKEAGISRMSLHLWRKDPAFVALERAAMKDSGELLLAACYKRAVFGVNKPVYQLGVLVGYERVYSDKLAEVLLKGMVPEMFKVDEGKGRDRIILGTAEQVADVVRRLGPTSNPITAESSGMKVIENAKVVKTVPVEAEEIDPMFL